MHGIKIVRLITLTACLFCLNVSAQIQNDTTIRLKGAVQLAEQRYHLLLSGKYLSEAASKGIDVAKYSRLPTIDATYQVSFGTANNLTGIFYPGGILPMTGPPSVANNYSPGTGSAAGVLLNWQAITFGQLRELIHVS